MSLLLALPGIVVRRGAIRNIGDRHTILPCVHEFTLLHLQQICSKRSRES
jgi:hypothetical protein